MPPTTAQAQEPMRAGRPAFALNRDRPAALQVYEDMRARIVSLALEPGATLSGAKLAGHYGVSLTPVREALLKLQQDGLVDIFPQSKTVVAAINVQKVREAQFLRSSMELEVAKSLALKTDEQRLDEPRDILRRQREALADDGDTDIFYLLDAGFHRALFHAAGYDGLWALVIERSAHLDRVRRLQLPEPGKPALVVEQHGRILDAIAAGDIDGADRAIRDHLSGALNELDDIVAKHPDFFDV